MLLNPRGGFEGVSLSKLCNCGTFMFNKQFNCKAMNVFTLSVVADTESLLTEGLDPVHLGACDVTDIKTGLHSGLI